MVGGQSAPHGPPMRAVQQGLLAGAAPQGRSLSPSLSVSPSDPWVSPSPWGVNLQGPTRCRGPIGSKTEHTEGGCLLNLGMVLHRQDGGTETKIKGDRYHRQVSRSIRIPCVYFTCQTMQTL